MTWAIERKNYSQRRACGLVGLEPKTYRYASKRPGDGEIRARLRVLAGERRRFGYRRLHILLAREGVRLNHKRLFRLYREERLGVRKRGGRKRALGTRSPMALPEAANQRWSLDFVSDALSNGRRFRVLAVVDDFTRECLGLVADTSLSGLRVGRELDRIVERRGCRPSDDRQRQRDGADVARDPALAGGAIGAVALHRAGQAAAERVRGELQRPVPGRMPERAPVQQLGRGAPDHRSMEGRLQHRTPTHEPRRAHPSSLCNPPQPGAYGERTLLMNEGTMGAGSAATVLPDLPTSDPSCCPLGDGYRMCAP